MERQVSFGMARSSASKFHNKPTMVKGIRFDSKKEALRYQQLLLLERNGEIREITRQVGYSLKVNGDVICRYYADFVYDEFRSGEWSKIVEDVKGYMTPMYRLKKKLMKACLGIEVRET